MDDILNALADQIEVNATYIAERIREGATENITSTLISINLGRIHAVEILGFSREADRLEAAQREEIFKARKYRADFLEMREAINSIPSVGGAA